MRKITAVLMLFVFLTAGCTTRLTDFTAISTKNLNLSVKKGARVEGTDCANLLFGLIPINGNFQPNLKQAIDNAIEKGDGDGDMLVDGVVYQSAVVIPFIYVQICYKVTGTVVSTSDK